MIYHVTTSGSITVAIFTVDALNFPSYFLYGYIPGCSELYYTYCKVTLARLQCSVFSHGLEALGTRPLWASSAKRSCSFIHQRSALGNREDVHLCRHHGKYSGMERSACHIVNPVAVQANDPVGSPGRRGRLTEFIQSEGEDANAGQDSGLRTTLPGCRAELASDRRHLTVAPWHSQSRLPETGRSRGSDMQIKAGRPCSGCTHSGVPFQVARNAQATP